MIYSEGRDGDAIWIETIDGKPWLVMGPPANEYPQQTIELTRESAGAIVSALAPYAPEHPHTAALRALVECIENADTCEVCGFFAEAGHAKTCELAQARALLGGAR